MSLPSEFKHEIFSFVTEEERQVFIADLRSHFPDAEFATNIDPVETDGDRFLVAVRMPGNEVAIMWAICEVGPSPITGPGGESMNIPGDIDWEADYKTYFG